MREIKFRAWDIGFKTMWHGGFYLLFNPMSLWADSEDGPIEMPTKQFEIMQYTGLKDKNGKEIYEGDFVKGVGEHVGQSEVFYGYGQWQPFAYLGTFNGNDFEVIGNIYENPELLSPEDSFEQARRDV